MKKGVAAAQIFIYATSVVVLGLIMYFGVVAIGSFNKRTCDIEVTSVLSTLDERIYETSNDFGERKKVDISLPCGATAICIADLGYQDEPATQVALRTFSPIAANAYVDGTANVFILKETEMIASYTVDDIEIPADQNGILCGTTSPLSYRMEGIGKKARLTFW